MPEAENRSSRVKFKTSRAYSVSPRVYLPRRPKSASPARNTSTPTARPKTAPHSSSRPSRYSMKPLTPRKVTESTPLKVVSKPKAGSDKPVAIRPRRLMKVADNDTAEENVEEALARNGYFVYVYNDQIHGDAGHADSRPMASVRPMLAVQVIDDNTNDKENTENKDLPDIQDDLDKSDIKPLTHSSTAPDTIFP